MMNNPKGLGSGNRQEPVGASGTVQTSSRSTEWLRGKFTKMFGEHIGCGVYYDEVREAMDDIHDEVGKHFERVVRSRIDEILSRVSWVSPNGALALVHLERNDPVAPQANTVAREAVEPPNSLPEDDRDDYLAALVTSIDADSDFPF